MTTEQLNVLVLTIGVIVLVLGLLSRKLKHIGLPAPFLALLLGVVIGPLGFHVLQPEGWGEKHAIMEQVTRFSLAVGLMGVALRVPVKFLREKGGSLLLILLGGMFFMWFSSSLIFYGLLSVSVWVALLLGAIVTPTDPVIASTIVTGDKAKKSLPTRLRHLISAESGFNDGLALPFILLPLSMYTGEHAQPWQHWLVQVWLLDVLLAITLGFLIGYLAGRLLKWAEDKKYIEDPSISTYSLALAFLVLGGLKLINSDGILAVFTAGLGFNAVVKAHSRMKEERVVEGVDQFFTLPTFMLLGVFIPWQDWVALGWLAPALIVLILLFRRLPYLFLIKKPSPVFHHWADALFPGWFGPIGVAALYYMSLVSGETDLKQAWTLTTLLACASVVVHGLTAMPFTRWYASLHPAEGKADA